MSKPKPPMELAMNVEEKHSKKFLPGYAQIKYDGIPITFIRQDGVLRALSRQNEEMKSVEHIKAMMETVVVKEGASITMECVIMNIPFKTASGIIRRQEFTEESSKIIGIIFDANINATPKETYLIRMKQAEHTIAALNAVLKHENKPIKVVVIKSVLVQTMAQIEQLYEDWKSHIPDLEGVMVHDVTKPFQPGKRCRGMGRWKPQPTIDLMVHSYEEATANETADGPPKGTPLGRVGRVNVVLRRQGRPDRVVGVGPGKLDHAESKAIWEAAVVHRLDPDLPPYRVPAETTVAEIKYMPDPSYDALRQPTIQRLRTDKTEGDILSYE